MAISKLPPANKHTLQIRVKDFLTHVFSQLKLKQSDQQAPVLLVALSGGLDSCVLLHILVQLQSAFNFELSVQHVHHGLSANADSWAAFCTSLCNQYHLPCEISHVQVSQTSALGIEATARNARYAALLATQADLICLAHHQDDQAETLLLQLSRGAGAKGLSCMSAIDEDKRLFRPLLTSSREELTAYAKYYDLRWVEDESNTNIDFDRNFIRHEVLPVLATQYPAIKKTLSRSAEHMAEVSTLLFQLAEMDAMHALSIPLDQRSQLDLSKLVTLSKARAKNVLRWWLEVNQVQMPSADQLQQIWQQLLFSKTDSSVKLKVGENLMIRKFNHLAYIVEDFKVLAPYNIHWQEESEIRLSPHSRLIFQQTLGQGIALKHLKYAKLRIKNREGGERIRPEKGRPSRTIQRMMQLHNIPPWQREQLPLVFMEETLVMIPNLAIDADVMAEPDEMGLCITWQSN